MVDKECDILIVGGGLTGTLLLLALANSGYQILLIDTHESQKKISPSFDSRNLALSTASVRILQTMGIWPLLQQEATPIHSIHVSEKKRFGSSILESKDGLALGFVVEMHALHQALNSLIDQKQWLAPAALKTLDKKRGLVGISTAQGELTLQAKLIVAADGTDSLTRKLSDLPKRTKNYQQHAIVANIGLARSHNYVAYERFTATGPIAMLPLSEKRSSLVWALNPSQAKTLLDMDEKQFLQALQKEFGYRLGRFIKVGKRAIFPLQQVTMPQKVSWPIVFIGNAAHTLHPVAAQGFNLGLRDVACLAQNILQKGITEETLSHYQQQRQHDEKAITFFTNSLIEIFQSSLPGAALARNLGLLAVDNLSILKKGIMHYSGGFAGKASDLICGISLKREEK